MRTVMMVSSLAMAGTERNVVSVAPYFKDQGVDLHLVSMNTRRDSPLAEEFAKTGIPRYDLDATRMVDPAAWRKFTQFVRDKEIDLIHAEDQDTIIYAALAHRRLGIPTVMTRHVLFEPADTTKETIRANMVLMAAKVGFNKIVTVSEAVRQDFAKRAGVSLDKIQTIYNGLPMERFHVNETKAELRQRFGWDADTPVVIMVAALRRGKGHEVLFQALEQVKADVPKVRVMLVGDGEIAEQIREQAQPLDETVVFLGQRTDVPELLHASDVATLPSWAEALPTVLIEAGAAKIPIVATDVGGAKEITIDGETGYIIPAGDADQLAARLSELLRDPAQCVEMGLRAHERVTAIFSLEQQAKETTALYQRILQS